MFRLSGLGLLAYLHLGCLLHGGRSKLRFGVLEIRKKDDFVRTHTIRVHATIQKLTLQGEQERGFQV